MKKILAVIGLGLIGLVGQSTAQELNTNTALPSVTGPAVEAIRFLSASATNWMVAPYGIYAPETKSAGGGIAAAYKLSDYVVPTLRLDYLDKRVWMPSADVQLQLPFTVMNQLTVIPFAFTGIATPISGRGDDNGSAVGMFGAGAAVRISKHLDLVADAEKWTGFPGLQYRAGLLIKFW